jgi:hypothetical protein
MEHVNAPINEIVVMYQSTEQVIRPPAPPDVSVCKGIMSCFSFLFLGVPRHYAKRPFSCWCKTFSCVREKRVSHNVVRELKRAKPGVWGCIQAHEVWSSEEETNMRLDTFGSASLGRFLVA